MKEYDHPHYWSGGPLSMCSNCGEDHRIRDEKGRLNLKEMDNDEIQMESLAIMRATQDLVEKFLTDFTSGKIGGPMGIFGKMLGGMK